MKRELKLLFGAGFLWTTMLASIFITMRAEASGNVPLFAGCMWYTVLSLLLGTTLVIMAGRGRKRKKTGDAPETPPAFVRIRTAALALLALLLCAGALVLGRIFLTPGLVTACRILFFVCTGLQVLAFFLEWAAGRKLEQKIKQMSIREQRDFLLNHRADAEKTAKQKETVLLKLLFFSNLQNCLFGILSLAGALAYGGTGPVFDWFYVPVALICAILLFGSFLGLRMFPLRKRLAKDPYDLKKEEYPCLYANAEKAMRALGVRGTLRVAVDSGHGAGIYHTGHKYRVMVGTTLLNVLSEAELYHVLLHEFAHVTKKNRTCNRLAEISGRMLNRSGFSLTDWIDRRAHILYAFYLAEYSLYSFAGSLAIEMASDRVAAEHGDPAVLASALFKLQYHTLFLWEESTLDIESWFSAETPEDYRPAEKEIRHYRSRLSEREQVWHDLTLLEIPALTASHPTVRMRAETLGVPDPYILPSDSEGPYAEEAGKAVNFFDRTVADSIRDRYESLREYYYLEPFRNVEKWEQDGKPLDPVGLSDLVSNLRAMGRTTEAIQLCDRVMAEYTEAGQNCTACFLKGTYLLHKFDEAGIELTYKALESNSNFIEEGIQTLGFFFCMTGREEDLEANRERAIRKAEEKEEKFDKMGTLEPTDELVPEQLPEGRLDELLDFLESIADHKIAEVFLVRKVITEDFFCSPVIISFEPNASDEDRAKILHEVFEYLDNCPYDWQFSLFDLDDCPEAEKKIRSVTGSSILVWE